MGNNFCQHEVKQPAGELHRSNKEMAHRVWKGSGSHNFQRVNRTAVIGILLSVRSIFWFEAVGSKPNTKVRNKTEEHGWHAGELHLKGIHRSAKLSAFPKGCVNLGSFCLCPGVWILLWHLLVWSQVEVLLTKFLVAAGAGRCFSIAGLFIWHCHFFKMQCDNFWSLKHLKKKS